MRDFSLIRITTISTSNQPVTCFPEGKNAKYVKIPNYAKEYIFLVIKLLATKLKSNIN